MAAAMEYVDAGLGFFVPACYEHLIPVGRGAFGLVVKSDVTPGTVRPNNAYFDRLSTNKVAIKKISSSTAYKDSYHSKQVYREISLLKQLTHENIIKLVDLFQSPVGDLYIVTEAMECDLATFINSTFEYSENHVRFIVCQIMRGLNYMHSAGVLHRDLKPQNILVNNSLEARICDLGLARVSAPRDGLSTGYVTTRWYRAPEVMLTWQHYTNALDMWSIGCIFAEMFNRLNRRVTFTDPKTRASYYAIFPADSHVEHMRMILNTIGAPPQHIIDAISESSIREFVLSMIDETKDTTSSLQVMMGNVSPEAIDLIACLLNYDPAMRMSAAQALEHPYLEMYREREEEYTRTPINTAFEGLELPVHMWQQMILQEIDSMGFLDDGLPDGFMGQLPEGDHAAEASVEDMLDLLPPDVLVQPPNRLDRNMDQIQSEQDQLMMLASRPDLEPPQRAQLMYAVGEVSTRLELYRQSMNDTSFPGDQ